MFFFFNKLLILTIKNNQGHTKLVTKETLISTFIWILNLCFSLKKIKLQLSLIDMHQLLFGVNCTIIGNLTSINLFNSVVNDKSVIFLTENCRNLQTLKLEGKHCVNQFLIVELLKANISTLTKISCTYCTLSLEMVEILELLCWRLSHLHFEDFSYYNVVPVNYIVRLSVKSSTLKLFRLRFIAFQEIEDRFIYFNRKNTKRCFLQIKNFSCDEVQDLFCCLVGFHEILLFDMFHFREPTLHTLSINNPDLFSLSVVKCTCEHVWLEQLLRTCYSLTALLIESCCHLSGCQIQDICCASHSLKALVFSDTQLDYVNLDNIFEYHLNKNKESPIALLCLKNCPNVAQNNFELFNFVIPKLRLRTKCLYVSDTLDHAFEALFTDNVCG
jgi:hypothetical protein